MMRMLANVFQCVYLIAIISTVVDGTMTRVIQLPDRVEAIRGTSVTFHCIFPDAEHNPHSKLYWMKQENNEYQHTGLDKRKVFGFDRNQTSFFRILNVILQDSGVYECSLKIEGKLTATGPGSHLVVWVPPTPLKIFSNVPKIGSPEPLTLVCETTAFYPENLILTWYKNGIKITSGINITKQQNAEGLNEISSFVEENKPVQSGVVYTCQVSHISLQIPEVANYTVQISEAGPDNQSLQTIISGCAGLTFLVLLIIGMSYCLMERKGSHRKLNGCDICGDQKVHDAMYDTVVCVPSDSKRHPQETKAGAKTRNVAVGNMLTYADLDLSHSKTKGNGNPECSDRKSEYAQIHVRKHRAGEQTTYKEPTIA